MCLVSECDKPSTSTYNIICYKILVPVGGKLVTPYRDFLFPLNEVLEDKVEAKFMPLSYGHIMIEGGYFHSYKSLSMAKKKVDELKRKTKDKKKVFKIYKAEIPSGTNFFEGQFEDICSKSLKIIEECCD